MAYRLLLIVTAVGLVGCGDDAVAPVVTTAAGGGGGGGAPVETGCPPGTIGDDPAGVDCAAPGVPSCAEGFERNGDGCRAVLPALPCPAGEMALPGDAACAPVADCGSGSYGDIATDTETQHVDQSYVGVSDGSAQQPWTSVQEAVDAAVAGATVALASGSYPESVLVAGKAITLAGRCPSMVTIDGPSGPAVTLTSGADGSVVRGAHLRATGSAALQVDGLAGVAIEQVWANADGTVIELRHATNTTIRRLLLDDVRGFGINMRGGDASMQELVTAAGLANPGEGYGIHAQSDVGAPASLSLERAVMSGHQRCGAFAYGASMDLSGLAIVSSADRGVCAIENQLTAERSQLSVRDSVIGNTAHWGIDVRGSDGVVERVTVHDGQLPGIFCERGVTVDDSWTDASLSVAESAVEHVRIAGIMGAACDLDVRATAVWDVTPGDGFDHAIGIGGTGANGELPFIFVPNRTTVVDSVVRECQGAGLLLFGDVTGSVDHSLVDSSVGNGGRYGDGVVLMAALFDGVFHRPKVALSRVAANDNVRAGVVTFGGDVSLQDSTLSCNSLDLTGQRHAYFWFPGDPLPDYAIDDLGNNRCGCELEEPCRALAVEIEPPPLPGGG